MTCQKDDYMKVRRGDTVRIMSGKDKGKAGLVDKVYEATNKVLIRGVNVVKKHVKPGTLSKEGGIISLEKPINVSKVMIVCPKCKKDARVGLKLVDGKKHRVCKKCGNAL